MLGNTGFDSRPLSIGQRETFFRTVILSGSKFMTIKSKPSIGNKDQYVRSITYSVI